MAGTGASARFRVDPAELGGTVDRLRAAARAVRSGGLLQPAVPAAGDPGVASALELFDQAWGRVWSDLDDDLLRLADALALLCGGYQQADQSAASGFDGIGGGGSW